MNITKYQLTGASHELRVVVLADFHDGDPDGVLASVRTLAPDAILVAGDVVHDADRFSGGLALLRSLITVAPVFCSLGNHEYRVEDIEARIRKTGVRLLDNTYTTLYGFVIGGLSSGYRGKKQGRFKKTPAPDTAWLEEYCAERGTHVLLCHHPEYYLPYLKDKRVELVLSGHAHGGQWSFLGQGLFAPGQGILPRFTSGLYRGKRRARNGASLDGGKPLLAVSRGLGNEVVFPRIGNPAEIVCIDFVK